MHSLSSCPLHGVATSFQEAKLQGINLLETYVFWDLHEPSQGQFYFPDYPSSANLVDYLRQAQEHGLYVHLRFGPYVCAEWNYGGLPVWLRELGNGHQFSGPQIRIG